MATDKVNPRSWSESLRDPRTLSPEMSPEEEMNRVPPLTLCGGGVIPKLGTSSLLPLLALLRRFASGLGRVLTMFSLRSLSEQVGNITHEKTEASSVLEQPTGQL
jgi:hypothetical protein